MTCTDCPNRKWWCWLMSCMELGERLADIDEEVGR